MIFRGTDFIAVLQIDDPDFDMTTIEKCHVTIENDSHRNQKVFTDCSFDNINKTISFPMSQEDTYSYEDGYILLQVRLKLTDGHVLTHDIIRTTMGEVLEDEIL